MTLKRTLQWAALGTGLLLLACRQDGTPAAQGQPGQAQAAAGQLPDFALPQVADGRTFHLSEHKGQVVLIDFWATWCGPCRMAIPHLIELQKEYGNKGFTVVGVSLDQQGEPVVKPFVQQWNINYPVVVDSTGSVARDYGGIRAIPTTLVLDKQGRLVGEPLVGYRPKEEYENLIKQALSRT